MTLGTPNKPSCTEEDEDSIDAEESRELARDEFYSKRIIVLNDTITERLIYDVFCPLKALIDDDPITPIDLYINSTGGSAHESLFLASYLLSSRTQINTTVLGCAMSGAAIISVAGTKGYRRMFRYSQLMWHLPQTALETSTSNNLTSQAKGVELLDEYIYDLLLNNTKLSKSMIKKKLSTDWYLTPQEALKYGIIDEIL